MRFQSYMIQWIGRRSPWSKLVLLLLPIIVSDLVLIIVSITALDYNNRQVPFLNDNKTALTFGDKSSFHDGNLEFLIDNNGNDSPKIMYVYGLDPQDKVIKSSSYLVDDIHKISTDSRLAISLMTNNTNSHMTDYKRYNITIPKLQYPGSYEGWIFVSGKDNVPFPVTLVTEPKVIVALLWVIIGILTSIIFWEIINYINQVKKAQTNPQINEEDAWKVAQDTRTHVETVKKVAQNQLVTNLPAQTREMIKQNIIKKHLEKYQDRRLTSKAFVRVSIIDLGTIIFGMAVGFLALLGQNYVTTMRVIGTVEVLAPIGLGLGIGSLREFVNKDSQQ
jgi:hypothetical protein